MSRKKLIRSVDLPYHLTARSNNREIFPGELAYVWKTLSDELYLQQNLYSLRIHVLVMMPNHFHLLATSPGRGIDLVMREFLGSSSRILNTRNRRSGHIFGGRYFWSLIRESKYYAHALKYVIRNPVRAGLCDFVADYPFSTFSGLVGSVPLPVAITPPLHGLAWQVPEGSQALDAWLNTAHTAEQNEAIRKALRRREFEFFATQNARRWPNFTI
jgi:putative transposase